MVLCIANSHSGETETGGCLEVIGQQPASLGESQVCGPRANKTWTVPEEPFLVVSWLPHLCVHMCPLTHTHAHARTYAHTHRAAQTPSSLGTLLSCPQLATLALCQGRTQGLWGWDVTFYCSAFLAQSGSWCLAAQSGLC